MIKKNHDIRKIKLVLPAWKSVRFWKQKFGPSVRLIQFLEKGKAMRGIVNKYFYNYNQLNPTGIKAFFSSVAAEKQLERVYERFYQKKLDTERHYYKSRPSMAYKMLKTFFDYDHQKITELVYRKAQPVSSAVDRLSTGGNTRENRHSVQTIESDKIADITKYDLAMITESVLTALTRELRRAERRKGK